MSLPQGKRVAAGVTAVAVQALLPAVQREVDREASLVQAQLPDVLLVRRMGEAVGVSTAIC